MKRFLLVPPTQPMPPPSPLARKLGELDAEMKSILDRNDLDEYEKAVQYSQVLEKYISVKQKMMRPTPIPLVEQTPPAKPAVAPVIPNKSGHVDLEQFPTQYRNRAQNLLKHIENQTDIRWNDRGELLVDGAPYAGSHIIDLLDDTVRHNKKTAGPPGSDTFVDALLNSNVPRTLIGNKNRLIRQFDNTPPPSPLTVRDSPRGHSTRGRGRRKVTQDQTGYGLTKWAQL